MTLLSNQPQTEPTTEPNPLEQQVMDEFQNREAQAAATEVPPVIDSPAGVGAESPQPVAATGGGESGAGEVETPQPLPSLPDFYDIAGVQVTPAQAEAALRVYSWSQGLSPEQLQAIDQVLAQEDPLAIFQQQQVQQVPPAPQPPAIPPIPPVPPVVPQIQPIDPYEDPAITQMRQQMAQMQAAMQAQQEWYQQQAQAQAQTIQQQQPIQPQYQQPQQYQPPQTPQYDQFIQQQRVQAAEAVFAGVRQSFEFNDAELELLGQRVFASGQLPGLEQQYGGDFKTALNAAIEQQVWTDPFFREKALAAQQAKEQAQAIAREQAKAASSALGGSTGSVPRPDSTQPPAPGNGQRMSRDQQIQGMAAEIAASIQPG